MVRTQPITRALAMFVLTTLAAGCSGGGGQPMQVQSTPTPTSTGNTTTGTGSGSGATSGSAYTCSTSDSASGVDRGGDFVQTGVTVRRGVETRTASSSTATGLIGVTYAGTLGTAARTLAATRESASGATLVREMSFPGTGRYERVLHVTPGTEAQALASLRTQPGVIAASVTGTARSLQTVSQKYYPNDPYYNGFTQTQLIAAGRVGNATYHVDPYEENASVDGQWGDHAVRLDYAQEYSQANNGSGVTNAGALGTSGVNIAIIDSGEDSTHPELSSKIVYQKCFITSTNSQTGKMSQSVSTYSVDEDGHGTNVSGIAAAASNDSLGFVGTGGAASIFAYRVFPTPDDTCVPGYSGTVDSQCDANVADISDAIDDAVAQKANVISLSLGGGGCTNGVDNDTTEQNAVETALSAGIVVVAAAGNANGTSGNTGVLSAPACISGVIAVGASGLADGSATGTSTAPAGSASAPVEYVAGYSQYGSPAAAAGSASAWGIVAPGGDPSKADASPTATSTDELHWIENIWTSTPYQSSSTDTSFVGECSPDLGSSNSTVDCRTLIAGTSQATPLVAGAAAAIIAANASYQSPTRMKQLLCTTAHDIGDAHEGCGRLDLYRAMATAVGDPNPPASN